MESRTIVVNINKLRERRALCNQIKTFAMNANGILFGGMVRDDIIGNHYRKQFIKKGLDFDKYWDVDYDEETKHRLITPNDMDIFFRVEDNTTAFLQKLQEFVKDFNGTVTVREDANFRQFAYTSMQSYLKHKIVTIVLYVGRTLFRSGTTLSLKIDIIDFKRNDSNLLSAYDYKQITKTIEPPFNNLDFLCNVFIMEKSSSGDHNIRISNSTGTPLDTLSFTEKHSFSAKVIDDIINFRTQFARNVGGYYAEYINSYRIMKMINRVNPWTITNLPFRFTTTDEIVEMPDADCCICMEGIKTGQPEIVEVNTYKAKRGNYLHRSCFIDYMIREQRQQYVSEETREIECRCPFRGLFNFRECHKLIDFE